MTAFEDDRSEPAAAAGGGDGLTIEGTAVRLGGRAMPLATPAPGAAAVSGDAPATVPEAPAPGRTLFSAASPSALMQPRAREARTTLGSLFGLAAACLSFLALFVVGRPGATDAAAEPAFVLSDLAARAEPRGAGEVLSVEGVIRNGQSRAAPAPALRIAMTDGEGLRNARHVAPGAGLLQPGATVRFRTQVAVPPGSAGDGEVLSP